MTQPGRQEREPGLAVLAAGVGVEHGLDRERVPDVMYARSARRGSWSQTSPLDESVERVVNVAVEQPGARGGHQERGGVGLGSVPFPELRYAASGDRRRVQGKFPGLVGLAVSHQHSPGGEVEVAAVQREGLTDPHAGHCEQSDQRDERGPAQWAAQPIGGSDQRDDLIVGVQIGHRALWPLRQQVGCGHFVGWVQRVQVGREPAHDRQPVGPPVRPVTALGKACPIQDVADGDHLRADCGEVVQALVQQLLRAGQPVAQRAAQRQVVGQLPTQRAGHDAPPTDETGHGLASTASASRSTLT